MSIIEKHSEGLTTIKRIREMQGARLLKEEWLSKALIGGEGAKRKATNVSELAEE